MTARPVDTLTAARKLRDSGMDATQAEAIVTTFAEGLAGTVVTKADIERLEGTLRNEIQRLEAGTKVEFQTVRGEFQAVRGDMQGVRAETQAVRTEMQALEQRLEGGIDRRGDRPRHPPRRLPVVGPGALATLMRLV